MSAERQWEAFFKSEVKTSGLKLYKQGKISIPGGSDTSIQAYVRVSPPLKVKLSSVDIASESFTAECGCPSAERGQFCKHIWAALLCTEEKYPDFLNAKQSIEHPGPSTSEPVQEEAEEKRPGERKETSADEKRSAFRASAKERASLYRKVQYQKQKLHAKVRKMGREGRVIATPASTFPRAVAESLEYFTVNGFPMPEGPSQEIVGEAKKKLSRVFHPDKGGSNEEMVELNRNCELLLEFLQG